MMIFWLLCATFIAIGLAFILPPLLQRSEKEPEGADTSSKEANVEVYRDQLAELQSDLTNGLIGEDQYKQDRHEFELRLLEDVAATDRAAPGRPNNNRSLVYLMAFVLPVAAVIFYLRVGHPSAVSATPAPVGRSMAATPTTGSNQSDFSPQRIEANVAALAKKLEENPNDVSGWVMLGRSYSSVQKYAEAGAAYKKATELKRDDADLLADYAFVLAMANGKKLTGEPAEIIKRGLKLDPENPKILELAGSAAFEANDFQSAIRHWEKVLIKAADDPELSRILTERIEEAKKRLKK